MSASPAPAATTEPTTPAETSPSDAPPRAAATDDEPPPLHVAVPDAVPAASPSGSLSNSPSTSFPSASAAPSSANLRYLASLGLHLNAAESGLAGYANDFGFGFHLTAFGAPLSWPVLFGLHAGVDRFGGPPRTIGGGHHILTSILALGAIRVTPDEGSVRPRVDLLGGLWALDLGVAPLALALNSRDTLGGQVTGAVGAGVGVDFLFREFSGGASGVGVGVQAVGGGSVSLPELNGPGQRETSNVGQLLFTLDYVVVSRR